MTYQVTARRWRPQSFSQLIGQEHISRTLLNALKNNRLPQALLLTGPRGTGKTSSARILAKSLRCPHRDPISYDPCNTCSECREIGQGQSYNVVEMDGASTNGVEAIRDLLEGVLTLPPNGYHKVYIIDEVHMLSISAFNALLKTLEEPPAHVIFILATTEVRKVPDTILSRCQRFDFRLIPVRTIANHLKTICEQEGIQADSDALWLIARQGEGSMRDAQVLLDQVLNFSSNPHLLSRETILDVLGLNHQHILGEALEALVQRSIPNTLIVLRKILDSGCDLSLFIKDLLVLLRDLTLIKMHPNEGPHPSFDLSVPDSEQERLKSLSQKIGSSEDLHLLFDMALKGAQDLTKTAEPQIVFDMLLLRMACAPSIQDLSMLIRSNSQPHQKAEFHPSPHPPPSQQPPITPQPSLPPLNSLTPTSISTSISSSSLPNQWIHLLEQIKSLDPILGAQAENLIFISFEKNHLTLGVPDRAHFLRSQVMEPSTQKKFKTYLDRVVGNGCSLEIQVLTTTKEGLLNPGLTSAADLTKERELQKQKDQTERALRNPKVAQVQSEFQGQITLVKTIPNMSLSSSPSPSTKLQEPEL